MQTHRPATRYRFSSIATIAGCALWMIAGCAEQEARPDRATVSGTVTYDGRPLTGGTITFTSEEVGHRGASGMIDREGRYRVGDAPIGANVVAINTESIRIGSPHAYVAIPSRYNEGATSGLRAELQPGENKDVDFSLEP